MRLALFLLFGVGLAGCTLDAVGINDDARDEVLLSPGTVKQIGDAFHIVFTKVTSDSRCAVDVVCVWQGDATVEIGLWAGLGPTHLFTLSLYGTPRSVSFAGQEVTFLSLSPQPRSDREIDPDSFRARFRIRPLPTP